jgi:spermidine synthase
VRRARILELIFFATGFAALLLQVVWQRLISLHAGVDLVASTTVVAAFMAGLGLGNLLGGVVADRISARATLAAYAGSVALIGIYGLASPTLLYDGYRNVAPFLSSTTGTFLFNFAVLALPTTLMGVSLPLLARVVVSSVDDAAHRLGRLYAINTFGAALGAALSGWYVLGTFGFVNSIRLASALYLLAAAATLTLWRTATESANDVKPQRASGADPALRWYIAYGLTGAVALGLEVVFLRLVDGLMRSNAYTFAHVLTVYLVCFAAGSALGSRWVGRAAHPGRTFLLLQLCIGATALLGLLALVHVPIPSLREMFDSYFASDGYLATGPSMPGSARAAGKFLFVFLFGPLTIMGLPVALMGLAYPFVQAEVSRELSHLGRGTGRLLFANIIGNVMGTLVVSFVLLDALGSAGTLRLLAALCVVLGLVGLVSFRSLPRPSMAWLGAAVIGLAGIALFPSNERLWAFFHSAKPDDFVLFEERSCVNAWVSKERGEQVLYLNATSQNGWPYDDFHLIIGVVPALMHPGPTRALAVGLGAGSTAWGLLQDERLKSVECVEICGGEFDLIKHLAARRGSLESKQLLEDPRSRLIVGDGRKHLLTSTQPWDVITVDAMRPNGASAGNVYSLEFYQLVQAHLALGGLFAQWVPTPRVLTTVKHVFPHVMVMEVPGGRGIFLVASATALRFDRETLMRRLEVSTRELSEQQRRSVLDFAATSQPTSERAGEAVPIVSPREVNSDLFPRDEYFLNSN